MHIRNVATVVATAMITQQATPLAIPRGPARPLQAFNGIATTRGHSSPLPTEQREEFNLLQSRIKAAEMAAHEAADKRHAEKHALAERRLADAEAARGKAEAAVETIQKSAKAAAKKAVEREHGEAMAQLTAAAQPSTRTETARRLSRTNAMQKQELDETRQTAAQALQSIAELKQQPAAATRQQTSQQSTQQQGAASPPIFKTRPLKDGGRFLPIVLVLLRLLVTACHVPQRNVCVVIDVCFTLFTGCLLGPTTRSTRR